jgi:hypothetical protein
MGGYGMSAYRRRAALAPMPVNESEPERKLPPTARVANLRQSAGISIQFLSVFNVRQALSTHRNSATSLTRPGRSRRSSYGSARSPARARGRLFEPCGARQPWRSVPSRRRSRLNRELSGLSFAFVNLPCWRTVSRGKSSRSRRPGSPDNDARSGLLRSEQSRNGEQIYWSKKICG